MVFVLILKKMFKKYVVRKWTEFAWFRIGSAVGSQDQGKEPMGFVQGKQLLEQMKNKHSQIYALNWYQNELQSNYTTKALEGSSNACGINLEF